MLVSIARKKTTNAHYVIDSENRVHPTLATLRGSESDSTSPCLGAIYQPKCICTIGPVIGLSPGLVSGPQGFPMSTDVRWKVSALPQVASSPVSHEPVDFGDAFGIEYSHGGFVSALGVVGAIFRAVYTLKSNTSSHGVWFIGVLGFFNHKEL